MEPPKKQKPEHLVNDNDLALGVVIFSGVLCLAALIGSVENDRARTALAVGASGLSGVIGFVGGKNRNTEKEISDNLHELKDLSEQTACELQDRIAHLETQLQDLIGPLT